MKEKRKNTDDELEDDHPSTSEQKRSDDSNFGKKRKLHTHEKAWQVYHKIQNEKKQKRIDAEKVRQSRAEAIDRYNQDKKRKMKSMYKKTKRGQPKLGSQVEYLLEKLQRQIEKEKK